MKNCDNAEVKEKINCISFVIPTYNRKETLKQTLGALFSQSYPKDKYEIIIVDDSSTDGTKEMIDKLINKSSCKIKYIRQKNQGPAVARNNGIKSSEGEIILFTDDDCVPEKDWISKHSRWYEKDVVGIGGFDETFSFPGGEDGDLATRILKFGNTVIDPNTIVYHLRENELSRSKIKQWFRNGRGDLIYRKKHGVLKHYQLLIPLVTIGKTFIYAKSVFRDEKLNALSICILYFVREVIADAGLLWEYILSRKH